MSRESVPIDPVSISHEETEWARKTRLMMDDLRVGDRFTDHFCPVALILKRDGEDIKVAKPESVDSEHYRWDSGEWTTVAAFKKRMAYQTIPGYWVEGWRE